LIASENNSPRKRDDNSPHQFSFKPKDQNAQSPFSLERKFLFDKPNKKDIPDTKNIKRSIDFYTMNAKTKANQKEKKKIMMKAFLKEKQTDNKAVQKTSLPSNAETMVKTERTPKHYRIKSLTQVRSPFTSQIPPLKLNQLDTQRSISTQRGLESLPKSLNNITPKSYALQSARLLAQEKISPKITRRTFKSPTSRNSMQIAYPDPQLETKSARPFSSPKVSHATSNKEEIKRALNKVQESPGIIKSNYRTLRTKAIYEGNSTILKRQNTITNNY